MGPPPPSASRGVNVPALPHHGARSSHRARSHRHDPMARPQPPKTSSAALNPGSQAVGNHDASSPSDLLGSIRPFTAASRFAAPTAPLGWKFPPNQPAAAAEPLIVPPPPVHVHTIPDAPVEFPAASASILAPEIAYAHLDPKEWLSVFFTQPPEVLQQNTRKPVGKQINACHWHDPRTESQVCHKLKTPGSSGKGFIPQSLADMLRHLWHHRNVERVSERSGFPKHLFSTWNDAAIDAQRALDEKNGLV
jgi:hypothetical protein